MLGRTYRVLNEITLDSQALLSNLSYYQKANPQTIIAPVIKSNAYGHGLKQIAGILKTQVKPEYTCVDSLFEAYELSSLGYHHPILIMGYTFPDNFKILKSLPYTFGVYDLESILVLNKYQPQAKIHLKIDTGMCRLGILPKNISSFINSIKKIPNLNIEGIYSHLSQADEPRQSSFTNQQLKTFKSAIKQFEAAGIRFKYKHLCATAGSMVIKDPELNLIRLGIGMYGISPFSGHSLLGRLDRQNLKPILSLTSHLAQIKTIPKGAKVGYGGTYTTKHQSLIGVLPLGYNEGLPRLLSNKAVFTLTDGAKCSLIGRVSMNMTAIKIPRNVNVKIGDPVTIINPTFNQTNDIYTLAEISHTIPYEIFTRIHSSIRRRAI